MLDDQGRVHVPQSFTETSMAAADRKVRKEDSDASVFNTQRVRVFPCQERNGNFSRIFFSLHLIIAQG